MRLHGFAKKIFAHYNLICPPHRQIGMFFGRSNKDAPFVMCDKYSNSLDEDIINKLTNIYIFIYEKRHPYSHAGIGDVDTAIISNRQVADEKFEEVITNMKSYYEHLIA